MEKISINIVRDGQTKKIERVSYPREQNILYAQEFVTHLYANLYKMGH